MISQETATDIAMAYREIEVAEKLLIDVREVVSHSGQPDIRDAFGRHQNTLELGIPSGDNSRRLLRVAYPLAIPIIEASIAEKRAIIRALNVKARIELYAEDAADGR